VRSFNTRGDEGYTDLLFGRRELKCHPQIEAYGEIDEAMSVLGLARAMIRDQWTKGVIYQIQQDLSRISTELATLPEVYHKLKNQVTPDMAQRLQDLIEELEERIELPRNFIIPGDDLGSAILDIARAIVRRIERRVVKLKEQNIISNTAILSYLNRLADFLFTLARYQENLTRQTG